MNLTTEASITKAAAEGVTKAIIESIVKPIVTEGMRGLKNLADNVLDLYSNRFSGYVDFQYRRNSYLNTIVFGNKKRLDELYLPLTVVLEESIGCSNPKEFRLDKFAADFLPAYKKVLITDTAGMGKSTLSKYLFLKCIDEKNTIPVFIELRQLSKAASIIKFIANQFNNGIESNSEEFIPQKRIERIVKSGSFCFFFDGYDEIVLSEREFVTKDLKDFFEKYTNNIFVITSRPESGLASFPEFSRFSIKPLLKNESYALITKYGEDGERSKQLIKKLEDGSFPSVEEFLKNPLLTTLLYRCFDYRQQIPLKKHVFYRQVFDALYDWHDSTKEGYNTREKKSNLDQDNFHKVLRMIGFISVMKGATEGDADTVLNWIRQAKNSCDSLKFSESDFLDDVIKAVPVFVKDGLYYRWSHKSLAEYFAAQYICIEGKLRQEQILTKIFGSDEIFRFENVLDQIYDMDDHAFKKYLVWPTLKAFEKHWSKFVKSYDNSITSGEISLRLSASFGIGLELRSDFNEFKHSSTAAQHMSTPHMFWGFNLNKGVNLFVAMMKDKYAVVIDILASKKDPLVSRLPLNESFQKDIQSFVWPKTKQKLKPLMFTHDATNELNSTEYFELITNLFLLLRRGVIVNHEAVNEFLSGYKGGESGLASLTDELLDGLQSKK